MVKEISDAKVSRPTKSHKKTQMNLSNLITTPKLIEKKKQGASLKDFKRKGENTQRLAKSVNFHFIWQETLKSFQRAKSFISKLIY